MTTIPDVILPTSSKVLQNLSLNYFDFHQLGGHRSYFDSFISLQNWLRKYYLERNTPLPNLDKIQGLLEASHLLIEMKQWDLLYQLLQMPMQQKSKNGFLDQLGIWGYYTLQKKLLLDCSKEDQGLKLQAFSLRTLGRVNRILNLYPEALQNYYESYEIFKKMGNDWQMGWTSISIGRLLLDRMDLVTAEWYFNRSLAHFEKINNLEGIAQCYNNMAVITRARGEYDMTVGLYQKIQDVYHILPDSGMPENFGWFYLGRAKFLSDFGIQEEAKACAKKALQTFEEIEHKLGKAWSLAALGKIYLRQEQVVRVKARLNLAQELFELIKDKKGLIRCSETLSSYYLLQGKHKEAYRYVLEVLEYHYHLKNQQGIASAFDCLGGIAIGQGKYGQGTVFISLANTLRNSLGIVLSPTDLPRFSWHKDQCKYALGSSLFSKNWRKGRHKARNFKLRWEFVDLGFSY